MGLVGDPVPNETAMTTTPRAALIDVAMGRKAPDRVIRNVNLINVLSREIHSADILISGSRIAAVTAAGGQYAPGVTVVEAEGLYAAPGFIDPHVHIESSMVTLAEYAAALLPRGTTMVCADPHEIGNILGQPGMRLLLDAANRTPLRVKLRVPGKIPAAPAWVETSNAELSVAETVAMFDWPETICLAGDINPALVFHADEEQLAKFAAAEERGLMISGQSPELTGPLLNAFIAAGPEDSHVANSVAEVVENTRLGMATILALRPGWLLGYEQWAEIAARVKADGLDTRMFQICTDDVMAADLVAEGHLDHRLRAAIAAGFDLVTAYQFVTLNVAQAMRIGHDYGAIAPGKVADIVLMRDPAKVDICQTYVAGDLVFDHGTYHGQRGGQDFPAWAKDTIRYARPVTADDMALQVEGDLSEVTVHALIEGKPGVPKTTRMVTLPVVDGQVQVAPESGLVAVAMVERHKASGDIGRGVSDAVQLQRGAIAFSINHDAHNVAVMGVSYADMAQAANRLAEIGGGFVLVAAGKVVAELALPVAGLMSEAPIEEVAAGMQAVIKALHDDLGAPREDKILTHLSFLALPNIPDFGFTNKGLVSSKGEMRVIEVIVHKCCGH